MIDPPLTPAAATPAPADFERAPAPGHSDSKLRAVARDLEASFLAEMLKHAELHATSDAFGGGIGEEQFSSFLVEAHADALAANGGIGLAESFFEALKERGNAAG